MWEIDIIIDYKYRKYLMYLKENITSSKNYNKKGVFALIKVGSDAILSIAIIDPSKELKKEIVTWIAECVVFSEKENYIKSKKILPNNEFKSAFLKALIMVDMGLDIKTISKEINLDCESINLHSLYKFRLKRLEKQWDIMLDSFFPKDEKLTSDKLMDILKSIISSNKKDVSVLVKKNTSDNFIIESENDDIYIKASDEADVIANLILLSPNKIKVTDENIFSNDSFILLNYLFSDVMA